MPRTDSYLIVARADPVTLDLPDPPLPPLYLCFAHRKDRWSAHKNRAWTFDSKKTAVYQKEELEKNSPLEYPYVEFDVIATPCRRSKDFP